MSLVALVPPVQGIRATLTASGISRVVVGGDSFQDTVIRRDPEQVALTSPSNATGELRHLDAQALRMAMRKADLLAPFEAMGVHTSWEFQLPRAANPFDFDDIADVLLTVEYTALSDPDYRRQIVASFDRRVAADLAIRLSTDRPDQWYQLHNPNEAEQPYQIAVARLELAIGQRLNVISGYRTTGYQAQLCQRVTGPCAPPGRSMHQHGLAIDITNWQATLRL